MASACIRIWRSVVRVLVWPDGWLAPLAEFIYNLYYKRTQRQLLLPALLTSQILPVMSAVQRSTPEFLNSSLAALPQSTFTNPRSPPPSSPPTPFCAQRSKSYVDFADLAMLLQKLEDGQSLSRPSNKDNTSSAQIKESIHFSVSVKELTKSHCMDDTTACVEDANDKCPPNTPALMTYVIPLLILWRFTDLLFSDLGLTTPSISKAIPSPFSFYTIYALCFLSYNCCRLLVCFAL